MAKGRYAQALEDSLQDEISLLHIAQRQQSSLAAQSQQAVGGASFGAPQAAASQMPAPAPEAEEAEDERVLRDAAPGSAPPPAAFRPMPAAPPPPRVAAKGAPPAVQHMVETLDERIGRLNNIREWLQQDDDLARLIDGIIGKQVRASERRQARLSVVLNVVFLLAGWGLSLISTPSSALGHIFGH